MPERVRLKTPFNACRYLYPVQKYLQSKSKVVIKRTKFWTFFVIPYFKGAVLPKSCPYIITPTERVVKFHKTIPPGSKDLAPNTLNFKPILDAI